MAPTDTTTEKRTGAADCASARCGIDAGCKQDPDGSWICICTHDLSPQRPDGSCPRFVVTGPHHRHPTKKALITIRRSSEQPPQRAPPTQQVISAQDGTLSASNGLLWLVPLVGVVIALTAALWLRRRLASRKRSGRQAARAPTPQPQRRADDDLVKPVLVADDAPVCLTKSVLRSERFTANPEYDWGADCGHQLIVKQLPDEPFKCFGAIRPEWIALELEIGEGCFGKVFRGRLRRPGALHHESVAVKVLKSAAGPGAHDELMQEAEIMASFSHDNILSLKGIVANDANVGPWLVFEYMALGDLAQLLRSSNGNQLFSGKSPSGYSLDQEDLHSIAEQIADGMAYLSSQHFVHRDLACRNCLVGERPDGLTVKISDFGMSRDVYTCDYYKIGGSRMLPVRWMAPESILYGKFTLESDVWSFGVVLWEVFALGVQPYYGHSNEQVVKLILQGILLTPPERAPALICDLLYGCWKTQPSDRLAFAEIHSRLKSRAVRRSASLEPGARTPASVTYVHLRHDGDDDKPPEYLQTLPDLPVHVYSNA